MQFQHSKYFFCFFIITPEEIYINIKVVFFTTTILFSSRSNILLMKHPEQDPREYYHINSGWSGCFRLRRATCSSARE